MVAPTTGARGQCSDARQGFDPVIDRIAAIGDRYAYGDVRAVPLVRRSRPPGWPSRTRNAYVQPTREHRLEELKLELAARFEAICRSMSRDDFAKLIEEMARFRLKYEDLEAAMRAKKARRPPAS